MKTTIDIADNLLARVKETAYREKTTVRSLVEEGLSLAIGRRSKPRKTKFKFVTFRGEGLTDEFKNASWDQIRDEIYRGRGT